MMTRLRFFLTGVLAALVVSVSAQQAGIKIVPASAITGGGALLTAALAWPLGTTLTEEAANTLALRVGTFRVGPSTGYAVVANTGIGYAPGLGGVVTQLTSKSTPVTLNTVTGDITMSGLALGAGTATGFTLTNSTIAATDLVVVQHVSGGIPSNYTVTASAAAGSAAINLRNNTAGILSDVVVIKFMVFKSATS